MLQPTTARVAVPRSSGTKQVLPRGAGNRVVTEAINNKGQIVGSYQLNHHEAALIQDGRSYALLDDNDARWWQLRACDINDDGVIVGTGTRACSLQPRRSAQLDRIGGAGAAHK